MVDYLGTYLYRNRRESRHEKLTRRGLPGGSRKALIAQGSAAMIALRALAAAGTDTPNG